MVDVRKLRARMALRGYTQKDVVSDLNAKGVKISENTFSAKMLGRSQFDCDIVDVICDILKIHDPAEKAEIFLASPSQLWDDDGSEEG